MTTAIARRGAYFGGSFSTVPYPVPFLIQFLGHSRYVLYTYLCGRADNETGIVTASNARLARETGFSKSTVRALKADLRNVGFIDVYRRADARGECVGEIVVIDMRRVETGRAAQYWLFALDPYWDWGMEYDDGELGTLEHDPRLMGEDLTSLWKGIDAGEGPRGGIQRRFMRILLAGWHFRTPDGARRQPSSPREIIKVINQMCRGDGDGETAAQRLGREIFADKLMTREPKWR